MRVPAQLSLFDEAAAPARAPTLARPQRQITLGGRRVGYALRRGRRRSIGFTIGPDGLAVSAPRWVRLAAIEAALVEKGAWILRKLHEQAERTRRLEASRIDWRAGGSIPFLGAAVTLVFDPSIDGAVLRADTATLRLGLPSGAATIQVRDLVQSWMQRQARRLFDERCAIYAERLGVRVRRIGLSSATTRWGSAGADGSIRLHWRLVHFSLPVIDYVVVHELAHLREMNHSAAFWDIVRSVLPGFESARTTLRDSTLPAFD